MIEHFPYFLALIVVIVFIIMLANKIKVAYPVLLVVAGLLICFIPGIPKIHIEPELIFIIFLPPLLYEAAWAISWKELWHWRRIVSSFALVVVFLTAMSVALVTNSFIPGFTLALGFLLGGIVSPPDAVSAGSILKFVKVPKSFSSILEGESLLNDASSLIIFQFALIAVVSGHFVWYNAALSFGWMLIAGIGIGLLVGLIFLYIHKLLPTDANMDIVLTLVTPYVMYIAAEAVHSSGVLAVVAGGLFLSNKRHRFLSSSARLKGYNVWNSLVFVLNGLVFLIIGLDLPQITEGLKREGVNFYTAIGYGLLVTAVLMVGRMISAYGALITTLIARNFINVASRNPGVKAPFLLGWTGMRGVVSLAAALSIPVHLADGSNFPHRNLILFITFVVILTTLVVQGLSLPWIIKKLKLGNNVEGETEEQIESRIKRELYLHTFEYMRNHHGDKLHQFPILKQFADKCANMNNEAFDPSLHPEARDIYMKVLDKQREWLLKKNNTEKTLDEEIIRKHLYKIDIEEEKLRYM